jgi:hypothetical protein
MHAMAWLIFNSFGGKDTPVIAMLGMIKEMIFFLRTAFRDSKEFAGSTIEMKTQGLGQGNGASLAGWCIICVMILQVNGAKGHEEYFIVPMSHMQSSLSAILYVENTDLLHLNMEGDEAIPKHMLPCNAQSKTGANCSLQRGILESQISASFILWTFSGHKEVACSRLSTTKKSALMFVPLPDGSRAPSQSRAVDDAQKTLRIITYPSGNSTGSPTQMKEKKGSTL